MTQQIINLGTNPNDGTGDVMRVAFTKVDNNFSELYSTTANITSNLSNLSSSVNIFEGQILAETGSAFDTANAAFTFANNQYTAMNAAFTMANTVNSLFYGAAVNAAAAFNMANSTVVKTNSVYALTNSAYNVANAAYNFANSLPLTATVALAGAAFDQANLAFQLSGEAFDEANAAVFWALSGISNAASAYNYANGISANTASAYRVANAAYNLTNVVYGVTNSVYYLANSAYNTTNAAYNCANTKVNTVNGVTTGTFTSQGDVYVYGNTTLSSGLHSFNVSGGTISKNINIIANIPTYQSTLNFYDPSHSTLYSSLVANTLGLYISSSLTVSGDIIALYGTTSDQRFKTNLEKISNPLEKISEISGYIYNWNDLARDMKHKDTSKKEIGLLAQELEKVLPEAVVTNENGYKGIHYEKVVALLVECIKEQQKQINELKGK